MVRILVEDLFTPEGSRYIEAAGLSTDDKPEDNIVTGSKFTEVDTGDEYRFNEAGDAGSKWVKSNPGGGGGGGGGLIVTITYGSSSYYSEHTMDKTAGEIKAAFEAGMPVVCTEPGVGDYNGRLYSNIVGIREDLDYGDKSIIGYTVLVINSYGSASSYGCNSLDDYPTYTPD